MLALRGTPPRCASSRSTSTAQCTVLSSCPCARSPAARRVVAPDAEGAEQADLLAEARKGAFFSYACGVAYKLLTDYQVVRPRTPGMPAQRCSPAASRGSRWTTTSPTCRRAWPCRAARRVPRRPHRRSSKGLSSSAATCVLVARAFNELYDLKMTVRGEMEYAYQGEILTPSQCGRMDQGCAYGARSAAPTHAAARTHR